MEAAEASGDWMAAVSSFLDLVFSEVASRSDSLNRRKAFFFSSLVLGVMSKLEEADFMPVMVGYFLAISAMTSSAIPSQMVKMPSVMGRSMTT